MKRESDEQKALAPASAFKQLKETNAEKKNGGERHGRSLVCSPLESTPRLSTNREDASQTSLFKGGSARTVLAQQIQLHKQASKGPRYLLRCFDAAIHHAAAREERAEAARVPAGCYGRWREKKKQKQAAPIRGHYHLALRWMQYESNPIILRINVGRGEGTHAEAKTKPKTRVDSPMLGTRDAPKLFYTSRGRVLTDTDTDYFIWPLHII